MKLLLQRQNLDLVYTLDSDGGSDGNHIMMMNRIK